MSEAKEQHLSPGWSDGQSGVRSVPPSEQRADDANKSASQSSTPQAPKQGNTAGQSAGRDSRSEVRR